MGGGGSWSDKRNKHWRTPGLKLELLNPNLKGRKHLLQGVLYLRRKNWSYPRGGPPLVTWEDTAPPPKRTQKLKSTRLRREADQLVGSVHREALQNSEPCLPQASSPAHLHTSARRLSAGKCQQHLRVGTVLGHFLPQFVVPGPSAPTC